MLRKLVLGSLLALLLPLVPAQAAVPGAASQTRIIFINHYYNRSYGGAYLPWGPVVLSQPAVYSAGHPVLPPAHFPRAQIPVPATITPIHVQPAQLVPASQPPAVHPIPGN